MKDDKIFENEALRKAQQLAKAKNEAKRKDGQQLCQHGVL